MFFANCMEIVLTNLITKKKSGCHLDFWSLKKTQYQYWKLSSRWKMSRYCFRKFWSLKKYSILIILLTILVICSILFLSCHTVVIPTLSCWWTLWRVSLDQRKIVTAFPVTRRPPSQQLCLVLFFYRLKHTQRVRISHFWLTILTLEVKIWQYQH